MIDIKNIPAHQPLRVIIGAGDQQWPGWIATQKEQLNLCKPKDWRAGFHARPADAFLCEHVWEHLTETEGRIAAALCNPKVAVSFWDGYEGYQIKGTFTIETSGKRYEETAAWIEDMGNKAGFPLKSKGAVILKIDEIFGLAPGPGAGKKLA